MAKLITEYHAGADLYSDGAVEDEMLGWFQSGANISVILAADSRWPVLYHLSPERRNLLEWYPFRRDAHLLEVGAGCGALTGLFAEKSAKVTAVELSLRRSRIIYERHRALENLEVIAGNIRDLRFAKKFDYITLVGVLEYARSLVAGESPAVRLLEICRGFLKPDGILFTAVENRFGLKYFAGARDDHTGRAFDGLEGYPAGGPAETWSRAELSALLKQAGFSAPQYFYPYPDYKLPDEIFSDAFLPETNRILRNAPNYDRVRYRIFDEKLALLNVIANNQFPFFANSFLVLAGPAERLS
ncbi:MAG: class I SAM-dependent methyltransferase [Kiritimatiellae bacterium]|nr:class I SAM-dependent methyltransferase [Kiritimatiellia bacterium]